MGIFLTRLRPRSYWEDGQRKEAISPNDEPLDRPHLIDHARALLPGATIDVIYTPNEIIHIEVDGHRYTFEIGSDDDEYLFTDGKASFSIRSWKSIGISRISPDTPLPSALMERSFNNQGVNGMTATTNLTAPAPTSKPQSEAAKKATGSKEAANTVPLDQLAREMKMPPRDARMLLRLAAKQTKLYLTLGKDHVARQPWQWTPGSKALEEARKALSATPTV